MLHRLLTARILSGLVLVLLLLSESYSAEIFVPKPRGAEDTLDNPQQDPDETSETVQTRRGNRLTGRITGIGQDGILRLVDPQYPDGVKVLVDALEKAHLRPPGQATGNDRVIVSNGDSILGKVTGISPEAILITTPEAGDLRMPRPVAGAVVFGKGGDTQMNSRFADGVMEPWKPIAGQWKVENGCLVCTGIQNDGATVSARVDQKDPLSVEVGVEAPDQNPLTCGIVVFAENDRNTFAEHEQGNSPEGICSRVEGDNGRIVLGISQNELATKEIEQKGGKRLLRLAYDPSSGKAKHWLDGVLMGECDVPGNIKTGKYVSFAAARPCKVHYIRIAGGMPSFETAESAAQKTTLVILQNDDRVSANQVTLENGLFVFQTGVMGEIKSQAENVRTVHFRSEGRERPRRQKGDVVVTTLGAQFTLKLGMMDESTLSGHSDYLGDVKIRRSMIRSIGFNPYDMKPEKPTEPAPKPQGDAPPGI